MNPSVERELDLIAGGQYGLITRAQAVAAGASADSIDRLCGRKSWTRVAPAVYRMAGAGASWLQDVMLAVLSVADEAAASHQTAAILWQLIDGDRYPIHVATTRARWRSRGFVVHRSTDLAEPYVTVCSGIRATTPTRTILDLGASSSPWTTERALDAGVRKGCTSLDQIEEIVSDLGRQGRRGVRLLRDLIAARRTWTGIAESELEDQFRRLVGEGNLPMPTAQHEVWVDGDLAGRVDFAYPGRRIAIELDGYAYHSDPAAFARDRERQNRLFMAGFRVLRYTAVDLRGRPEEVIQELKRALSVPVNANRARRG